MMETISRDSLGGGGAWLSGIPFSFFFFLFSTTLGGDMMSFRGEGFFSRRSDRRGPGSIKFPFDLQQQASKQQMRCERRFGENKITFFFLLLLKPKPTSAKTSPRPSASPAPTYSRSSPTSHPHPFHSHQAREKNRALSPKPSHHPDAISTARPWTPPGK